MRDALTLEALQRVQICVSVPGALSPAERAALLRQILAVASGQLASLEGAARVERVQANILRALRCGVAA